MTDFLKQYLQLLIKQYFEQPNARAEVIARIQSWEKIYNFVVEWRTEFDLDTATGDRLDKIGKIVGLPRNTPNALTKVRFGFDGDPSARGFTTLDTDSFGAPFFTLGEEPFTDFQLDDNDYRLFIRAKIAVNQGSAYLVTDEYLSLQDVIETLFEGAGYVLDNYDMSLTLYVPFSVDQDRLNLIKRLNLLPKPQAVRYDFYINGEVDSFGFDDDVGARGFGSLFDSSVGGSLASLYSIS